MGPSSPSLQKTPNPILLKITYLLLTALTVGAPVQAAASNKVLYVDQATGKERAQGVFRVSRAKKDGEVIMVLTGRGAIEGHTDARFQRRSRLKDEGYLKPVESEVLFYSKRDKVTGGYRYVYDYEKRQVNFQHLGAEKAIEKEELFPIDGSMTDAVNLPVFLERFLPMHEGIMAKDFYFISNEPKIYKMDIQYRGMESIQMGDKQVYAKKIELIAETDRFSEIANIFHAKPKTFLWLSPDKPYRWLQYQGAEKGPDSEWVVIQHRQE